MEYLNLLIYYKTNLNIIIIINLQILISFLFYSFTNLNIIKNLNNLELLIDLLYYEILSKIFFIMFILL